MNGVISARTTVKMRTATMNDVTSISMPSSTSDATIRPTAFASNITAVRTMTRITRLTLHHRRTSFLVWHRLTEIRNVEELVERPRRARLGQVQDEEVP